MPVGGPIITNSVLWRCRATLLVTAVTFGLVALPSQAIELHIITAEKLVEFISFASTIKLVLFSATPRFLSIGPSFADYRILTTYDATSTIAAVLLLIAYLYLSRKLIIASLSLHPLLGRATPRQPKLIAAILSAAPLFALACGFYNALTAAEAGGAVVQINSLRALTATFLVGAIGLLIFYLLARYPNPRRLFTKTAVVAFVCAFAAFIGAFLAWPIETASILGAYSALFLFLIFLHYTASLLQYLSDEHRVPLLAAAPICAVLFAVLGINDNHEVVAIPTGKRDTLEGGFIKWLDTRPDKAWYAARNLPYPVFVVSAEGGGLYAAYNVANALGTLQERCPAFASHTFGISGVSGGSLGAALFLGLSRLEARDGSGEPCREGTAFHYRSAVRRFFNNDFLSPLLIAGLFPDFLQRFIPYPIAAFDRAKYLAKAMSWHFGATLSGDPSSRFVAYDDAKDNVFNMGLTTSEWPYLFLNTTSVATGARITISPLWFDATPTALHIDMALHNTYLDDWDLDVGTAVGLSARFPWITPAGWINSRWIAKEFGDKRASRLYLVDGGYFENSGIETAAEIAIRLRAIAEKHKARVPATGISINLLEIGVFGPEAAQFSSIYGDLIESGPAETIAPIVTLMRTRMARANAVDARLSYFDDSLTNLATNPTANAKGFRQRGDYTMRDGIFKMLVGADKTFLPLGWIISQRTRRIIEEKRGVDGVRNFGRDDVEVKRLLTGEGAAGAEAIAGTHDGVTPLLPWPPLLSR